MVYIHKRIDYLKLQAATQHLGINQILNSILMVFVHHFCTPHNPDVTIISASTIRIISEHKRLAIEESNIEFIFNSPQHHPPNPMYNQIPNTQFHIGDVCTPFCCTSWALAGGCDSISSSCRSCSAGYHMSVIWIMQPSVWRAPVAAWEGRVGYRPGVPLTAATADWQPFVVTQSTTHEGKMVFEFVRGGNRFSILYGVGVKLKIICYCSEN